LELPNVLFVDVRSPGEFSQDTIPGAVNLPLFSDEERAEIGTIYRQVSPRAARRRGLELVAPRLPAMVETVEGWSRQHDVVVFCWRGGERSQALVQVLELMKVPCRRLAGGYRAYRRLVVEQLAQLPRGRVVVLHGLTGCGKTQLLGMLAARGYPVVDLEGLARHRGSVFGGVGLGCQPSQKMFESLLRDELWRLREAPYVVVECESRRIGRLFLPDRLYAKMQQGIHLLVYDSVESRARRLVAEYAAEGIPVAELRRGLQVLARHLGRERVAELAALLEAGRFEDFALRMLSGYYDRLYRYPHGPHQDFAFCVSTGDLQEAADALAAFLDARPCEEGE
jgi:tRNA 2-selenouridine synthase